MRTKLLAIVLTVVGFSLTGWGDPPPPPPLPNPAPYQPGCGPKPDEIPQGYIWNSCTIVPDVTASNGKDASNACQSLWTAYNSDAASAAKDKKTDLNSLQNDYQKAVEDYSEKIQKINDDAAKANKDYQDLVLKNTKSNQKDTTDLGQKINDTKTKIANEQALIPLKQNDVTTVESTYTAVVSANSPTMVRSKCLIQVKQAIKSSDIRAGSATSAADLNAQWNSCIAVGTANASAAVSDQQSKVIQAQAELLSLQNTLKADNALLTQLNSTQTQDAAMAKQESSSEAQAYQTNMQNLQTKLKQTQSNGNQKLAILQSQIGAANKDTVLDTSLINIKANNCCNPSLDPASVDNTPESADASANQTGLTNKYATSYACPKTSSQTAPGIGSTAMTTALQQLMGQLDKNAGVNNGLNVSPTNLGGQ